MLQVKFTPFGRFFSSDLGLCSLHIARTEFSIVNRRQFAIEKALSNVIYPRSWMVMGA